MASFGNSVVKSPSNSNKRNSKSKSNTTAIWKAVRDDLSSNNGGDRKILRAIARTATVNVVIAGTAVLGPLAAVAGYATGGAITAKRLVGDGILEENHKEIVKSVAVFGTATTCSVAGQALTGAVLIGVVGASLPVAGAIAFVVGCVSGVTGGALSEWGVDGVMVDDEHDTNSRTEKEEDDDVDDDKTDNKNNLVDSFVLWNHRRQQRKRNCCLQQKIATQQEIISQAMIKQQQQCPQQEHSSISCTTTSSSPIEDKNFSPSTCDDTLQDSSSHINQSVAVHSLSPVPQPILTIAHETLLQQTETCVQSPTDCSNDPTENIWSID